MDPAIVSAGNDDVILDWDALTDQGGQDGEKISRTKILRRRSLYETFAQEAGFGIDFDESTSFDHDSRTVHIGIEQMERIGIKEMDEVDFLVFHELGHLKELMDDPEGYLTVVKEAKRPDGLGKLVFRLYNCLMDIYVNTNTRDRAPTYRDGEGFSQSVVNLYHKAFPGRDFSEKPHSVQFMEYLLSLGMDSADDIKLSPQVRKIVDSGIKLGGVNLGFKDLIDRFLRPVVGKSDGWQATITQRKEIIDGTIRPIFEGLIRQDLEEQRIMVVYVPGSPFGLPSDGFGSGEAMVGIPCSGECEGGIPVNMPGGGKGFIKPMEVPELLGGSLDPDELEELLRERIEENESMDPGLKEIMRQLGLMAGTAGLTPDEARDFQRIYKIALPHAQELIELFERLKTKEISIEVQKDGFYRTGTSLDVPQAILRFGDIQEDPSQVEVMNRRRNIEHEVVRPVQLRIRLLPDLSGSMGVCIEQLRVAVIAVGIAMSTMNIECRSRGEDFRCTLDVIGFNGSPIPIAHKLKEIHLPEIMRIYQRLSASGGTSDHHALELVKSTISPEDREKILRGEIVDILIEITDGETTQPEVSRSLVQQLSQIGVRMSAIRFGSDDLPSLLYGSYRRRALIDPIDTETFTEIWGDRGRIIGSVSELSPALFSLLKDSIEEFLDLT